MAGSEGDFNALHPDSLWGRREKQGRSPWGRYPLRRAGEEEEEGDPISADLPARGGSAAAKPINADTNCHPAPPPASGGAPPASGAPAPREVANEGPGGGVTN